MLACPNTARRRAPLVLSPMRFTIDALDTEESGFTHRFQATVETMVLGRNALKHWARTTAA